MSAPLELAARLFRTLFSDYDLVAVDGTTISVPKDGTIPVFTGTLTEIAWQIAEHASRGDVARPAAGQRPAPDPRPTGSAARGGQERTAGEQNRPPEESHPGAPGPDCLPGRSVRGTGTETRLKHYPA